MSSLYKFAFYRSTLRKGGGGRRTREAREDPRVPVQSRRAILFLSETSSLSQCPPRQFDCISERFESI